MKIFRDGKEIELTYSELHRAHEEMEHYYDVLDVESELEDRLECPDETEPIVQKIFSDADMISNIAYEYRKLVDSDKYRLEAISNAVDDAIRQLTPKPDSNDKLQRLADLVDSHDQWVAWDKINGLVNQVYGIHLDKALTSWIEKNEA